MKQLISISTSTVLITGGSEGIGLGLAIRFLAAGSTVIITGRDKRKLDLAVKAHPKLLTFVNDIGIAQEREKLAEYIKIEHPSLNILINNAGIQRRISLAEDNASWSERQQEIDILLSAPIHLNSLLTPLILAGSRPALIANVSSGGAFIPQPFAPIYSACKAALHSYTVNLRFSLEQTACRVAEIIPPAVRTTLAGASQTHGAPLDEFCDVIFDGLIRGEKDEIGFGFTDSEAFKQPIDLYRSMFNGFSQRFPIKKYN